MFKKKSVYLSEPHAILLITLLAFAISASGNKKSKLGVAGQSPATAAQTPAIDPAAWGSNHVGKPIPEYVHGDECLFCHRNDIGTTWQKNSHGLTVRQQEDAPLLQSLVRKQPALSNSAKEIEYFLGSRNHVRFLRKDGYGKFSILNTQAVLSADSQAETWIDLDKPSWDKERFGTRCAGCHATGVDPAAKTFTAFGLECYVCHGDVTLEHTKNTSLMWLSKRRRDDARAITSICGQCHLRQGKSRSTGLAYPNNFIAGDNLFQDYEVDFARADDETLNPGDRHILHNVRDVVVRGQPGTNCLSCHQLHANTTAKHARLPAAPICSDCHGAKIGLVVKPYVVHSSVCEY
jgi:predicted adenine nucleotide alpha hydrolase (AANH) superfamily ATPase